MKTVVLALLIVLAACSQQSADAGYTGVLKIDSGTEYAALESPSAIGGACAGWNAVEIRKPGAAGTGVTNLLCWKRAGDEIVTTTKSGAKQTSGLASVWSD